MTLLEIKLYLIFSAIIWSGTSLFGQDLRTPPNDFEYVDCGCDGNLKLDIYNGLDDASGDWGGQKLPYNKKWSRGAITVANLNDTDGDGDTNGDGIVDVLDKDDVDGISLNAKGRDELDLMRLVINPSGKFTVACTTRLELIGSIKLYDDHKKTNEITNLTFPLQVDPVTNKADDIVLFVEAYDVSTSVRDIEIRLFLGPDEVDKVRATAMWVERKMSYATRSNMSSPASLGVDLTLNEKLLNTIDNNLSCGYSGCYAGFRAIDGSRYGFGHMKAGPNWNGTIVDYWLGGRVLFEFDIYPPDLVPEFGNLGIDIDITRRKNTGTIAYLYGRFTPDMTVTNASFHDKNEMSNDDDQLNGTGGLDKLDEDKTPMSSDPLGTSIFSFDAPSARRVEPKHARVAYKAEFEEFVRVSFKKKINGNSDGGSRCSEKWRWSNDFSARCITTSNPTRPWDFNFYEMEIAAAGTTTHTRPAIGAIDNQQVNRKADGNITITPLTANDLPFIVYYKNPNNGSGPCWVLAELTAVSDNGGPLVPITVDCTSGPTWTLASNDVEVVVTQGVNFPFTFDDAFYFSIFTVPDTPTTNKLIVHP